MLCLAQVLVNTKAPSLTQPGVGLTGARALRFSVPLTPCVETLHPVSEVDSRDRLLSCLCGVLIFAREAKGLCNLEWLLGTLGDWSVARASELCIAAKQDWGTKSQHRSSTCPAREVNETGGIKPLRREGIWPIQNSTSETLLPREGRPKAPTNQNCMNRCACTRAGPS